MRSPKSVGGSRGLEKTDNFTHVEGRVVLHLKMTLRGCSTVERGRWSVAVLLTGEVGEQAAV